MRENGLARARSVVSNEPRTVRTPGRSRPICWTRTSRQAPDQRSADISYIWTAEGWLYLAVLIDLFSRRVVGWAVSAAEEAARALRMALVTRHPPSGLIRFRPRQPVLLNRLSGGAEKTWLADLAPERATATTTVVETFFKTIKSELIWPVSWRPAARPRTRWPDTDGFYNPIRRHSTLATRARSTSRWRAESEQSALH